MHCISVVVNSCARFVTGICVNVIDSQKLKKYIMMVIKKYKRAVWVGGRLGHDSSQLEFAPHSLTRSKQVLWVFSHSSKCISYIQRPHFSWLKCNVHLQNRSSWFCESFLAWKLLIDRLPLHSLILSWSLIHATQLMQWFLSWISAFYVGEDLLRTSGPRRSFHTKNMDQWHWQCKSAINHYRTTLDIAY